MRASLPAGLAAAPLGAEAFDLVFADPPYAFDAWADLLDAIAPKLHPEGEVVIEHAARADLPAETARPRAGRGRGATATPR